jgi:CBS domain-containing protein
MMPHNYLVRPGGEYLAEHATERYAENIEKSHPAALRRARLYGCVRLCDNPAVIEDSDGGYVMHVSDILANKGRPDVITITPDETMEAAAKMLHSKHIGALIVSSDGESVLGVLSERDIARSIALKGSAALSVALREFMTSKVVSCKSTDSIANVMKQMSSGRFRHVPVIEGERLIGMVSIGDVVKHRLEETQQEADALRDYVLAGH